MWGRARDLRAYRCAQSIMNQYVPDSVWQASTAQVQLAAARTDSRRSGAPSVAAAAPGR
jgi:hypothetical protein